MTPNVRTATRLFILASVILVPSLRGGSGLAVQAAESGALAPAAACARGTDETRRLSRWGARQYTVHLPPSYSRRIPLPVVIDIHGGGGNKEDARLTSCPDQDPDNPGCLDRLADCEGFIVVYPDDTQEAGQPKTIRSFNAGGGVNGYVCM